MPKEHTSCRKTAGGQVLCPFPLQAINDKTREYYNRRMQEEQDKLGYYNKCMKIIDPDFTGESKPSGKRKSKGISNEEQNNR